MKKPRILIFTTSYHPFVGGAEVAIQEITKRLKDRFDFYIVTSRFRRDLPAEEVRPEGKVIRLGFGSRWDKYLLPLFAFWNLELGTWNFPKQNILLWGVDIGQGSLTAALYKIFHPRVKFIFNIQYGGGDRRVAFGRLGMIGIAFRFILWQADYVTAISSYLSDLARKYGYKGPGEVVHNGVDVEKFIRPSVIASRTKQSLGDRHAPTSVGARDDKGSVIITTSRLVPKNGVDTLIKAIAKVKKQIPDIQCHIIGDGPERENYQLLVTSYRLKDNVKFFGSVPYAEIPKYLHQADLFVRPSRSEGMGNSFVEALAAGIPIIGTPVGGITDIIEDGKTGFFARREDQHDLADKIILVLKNQDAARATVEEGGRRVIEHFSWDKISEKYTDIFYRDLAYTASIAGADPLRILIATPLLPPQLGGPALYADNLAREFQDRGHHVFMHSFGSFLSWPTLVRHFLYFFSLWRDAHESDLVFALDYTSVGLPAAVVALFLRKPLVIRVEGDFLWESFVERTRKDVTLPMFYDEPQPLSPKERLVRSLSGWAMRRASRVVFSSEWRRKMVVEAYNIPEETTAIVRNAKPDHRGQTSIVSSRVSVSRIILWAGRVLYLKNLYRLIRAFSRVNDVTWELHLVGDGPEKERLKKFLEEEKIKRVYIFPALPREKLLKKISSAVFFVLPSFSEVGPNVIAEAVSTGTPFIMTKYSGYAESVGDAGFLVDPLSEEDMARKLKALMDESTRQEYELKLKLFSFLKSWPEVAQEWLKIFQSI